MSILLLDHDDEFYDNRPGRVPGRVRVETIHVSPATVEPDVDGFYVDCRSCAVLDGPLDRTGARLACFAHNVSESHTTGQGRLALAERV